ncbi:hypothetical protein SDC9_32438 [bioreactor metagenome]|uniref:Uncharacterized protein n=1 Tax=bioreactor metagenome TaxID=1076179 RepID=A0A644V546_9ZZZZ
MNLTFRLLFGRWMFFAGETAKHTCLYLDVMNMAVITYHCNRNGILFTHFMSFGASDLGTDTFFLKCIFDFFGCHMLLIRTVKKKRVWNQIIPYQQ